MTLARRLAQIEARRACAGVPETLAPELVEWITDYRHRTGTWAPDALTKAEIAHWAARQPHIDLPALLARLARVDDMI